MLSYSYDLNNCFPCSSVLGVTCSSPWWIRWSGSCSTWGRSSAWWSTWWWWWGRWRRWRRWRWWRWWRRWWRRRWWSCAIRWWFRWWRTSGFVYGTKTEADAEGTLPCSRSFIWIRWHISWSSWPSSSWSSTWCSSWCSSQWSPLQEDESGVVASQNPPSWETIWWLSAHHWWDHVSWTLP